MNITYIIENYYPSEQRCFVVYYNGDLEPYGNWVNVSEAMTEDDINIAILNATPYHKWQYTKNQNISSLIGKTSIGVYIPPVLLDAPAKIATSYEDIVRRDRNSRLTMCDWTQFSDNQLSELQKAVWETYRQNLRDVTSQPGFPENINWPNIP